MTNEDMAFKFANKNADKYINDEDPLGALRDGFLCGAQWKEKQIKSPWHKASEELPKEEGTYLLRFWAGCSFQIFIP